MFFKNMLVEYKIKVYLFYFGGEACFLVLFFIFLVRMNCRQRKSNLFDSTMFFVDLAPLYSSK